MARQFVNRRAALYRHRDSTSTLCTTSPKALYRIYASIADLYLLSFILVHFILYNATTSRLYIGSLSELPTALYRTYIGIADGSVPALRRHRRRRYTGFRYSDLDHGAPMAAEVVGEHGVALLVDPRSAGRAATSRRDRSAAARRVAAQPAAAGGAALRRGVPCRFGFFFYGGGGGGAATSE